MPTTKWSLKEANVLLEEKAILKDLDGPLRKTFASTADSVVYGLGREKGGKARDFQDQIHARERG